MDLQGIFSILGVAMLAVAFLAASVAYLRGSADRVTIASLESSVSALRTENDLLRASKESSDEEVRQLKSRVDAMERMKTQADEIAHVTHILEKVCDKVDGLGEGQAIMKAALVDVSEAVTKRVPQTRRPT